MTLLRIALCQIECHPALYAGYWGPLEEPFVPKFDSTSLSLLSSKGLDVTKLQNACIKEYTEWSKVRLRAIIDYLSKIEKAPDLIIFPEGAIPLPCLSILADYSAELGFVILAGTHTPRLGRSGRRYYQELNLSKSDLKTIQNQNAMNVLPLMRQGKTVLVAKTLHAPFEMCEISPPEKERPAFRSYSFSVDDTRVDVLPLICSEALRLHNVSKPYDLVTVQAYDGKPAQFLDYIRQQVRNQNIVALCNDGRFGGSYVFTAVDKRNPNWLSKTFPSGLGRGESLLIVDVDLEVRAVQVGTSSPRRPLTLARLASITYEDSLQSAISDDLGRIGKIKEPGVRSYELKTILKRQHANNLQKTRIAFLYDQESRELPIKEWWNALGEDCKITGIPSLTNLERRLAATCHEAITEILKSTSGLASDVATHLVEFLSKCLRKGGNEKTTPFFLSSEATKVAVVDRDSEVKRVLDSVDDRSIRLVEISGLEQIGKSAIIQKALAQSGISSIIHVQLTETSSIEYLLYSITKQGGGDIKPPYDDPLQTVNNTQVINAIRSSRIIYIESLHHFQDHGTWRDELVPKVLRTLIEIATDSDTTVIFESRWRVPLDMENPSIRTHIRVSGLEKQHMEFGISLFDAQLRRNALSSAAVGEHDKEIIVSKLGGHPVAVTLAADVVFEEGIESLLTTLKEKRGFFLNYVKKLVSGLNLSKDENLILQILALARRSVPREAIFASVEFSAALIVQNLVNCGALELDSLSLVQLPGILRGYFNPQLLSQPQKQIFHKNAAESFKRIFEKDQEKIWAVVEAEYHAGLAGIDIDISSELIDGVYATFKRLYEEQSYNQARPIIKALLNRQRTHDLLRFSAIIDARTNHLEDALETVKEIFSKHPNDTWILSIITRIAINQYQADQIAEELISIARNAGFEDVSLLITEGRILLHKKRLPEAYRVFSRAVELTTYNPWPFYYLGRTHLQMGDVDKAIDVLYDGEEFCYEIDSRNRQAYNAIRTELGLAYIFSDQIDLASPIIDSLIEEEPDRPEIIRAHAALTIKREGIQKAHIALKRLGEAKIKSNSDRCLYHLLCGKFYQGIDDLPKAVDEFTKAHEAERTNVYVMMKLAETHFHLGKLAWKNQSEGYQFHYDTCARTVRKILEFDNNNSVGLRLFQDLHDLGVQV